MSPIRKHQLVKRAAELMGRDQLAMRLGISESLLEAWIQGDVTMPDGKLLILGIVVENAASAK